MDPFSALLKSLQSVFDLEALRNEKYVFAPIQALKNALDHYEPEESVSYFQLLKAIVASKPFIEKWRLNFDEIKECMDSLAKKHQLSSIDWEALLAEQKMPNGFNSNQFSDDLELIPWLESNASRLFSQLNAIEKTKVLLDHVENSGFSRKFNLHLRKYPDFLFHLLLHSEQNFITIAGSRLNLYLTDPQLALGIIKHTPKLLIPHSNVYIQIEKLIDKLNEILANGRSITTLLRNEEAKKILEQLEVFRKYQSNEYKMRHDPGLQLDTINFF